jgi:hypothetical protein
MTWDINAYNELVIDTYDKEGRHIICIRDDWLFHVCNEKGDHAFMINCMDDVIYTLENADKCKNEIYVDRDDKKQLTLDYQMRHRTDRGFVRVVVEFDDISYKEGKIITAFMPMVIRSRDIPLILIRRMK